MHILDVITAFLFIFFSIAAYVTKRFIEKYELNTDNQSAHGKAIFYKEIKMVKTFVLGAIFALIFVLNDLFLPR